jgi:hypothetical protein
MSTRFAAHHIEQNPMCDFGLPLDAVHAVDGLFFRPAASRGVDTIGAVLGETPIIGLLLTENSMPAW